MDASWVKRYRRNRRVAQRARPHCLRLRAIVQNKVARRETDGENVLLRNKKAWVRYFRLSKYSLSIFRSVYYTSLRQLTCPAEKLKAVNLVSGSASLSAPSRSLGLRRAKQRAFAELMSHTCSSFWSVSAKAANFMFAEVCVCAAVMLIRTFLSLIKFIMP